MEGRPRELHPSTGEELGTAFILSSRKIIGHVWQIICNDPTCPES